MFEATGLPVADLQVAPSVEAATAKHIAVCEEFSVEDTYPAPTRSTLTNGAAPAAAPPAALPASAFSGAAGAAPLPIQAVPAEAGGKPVMGSPPASLKAPSAELLSKGSWSSLLSSVSATSAAEPARAAAAAAAAAAKSGAAGGGAGEPGKGVMAARTLMFFRGCARALGCTVLLKGAPRETLVAVKKVMQARRPP